MINNLLAVGDCITLGIRDCLGNSYPERVAKELGCSVTNKGYTMSSSREGIHLLKDNLQATHDCVILQFGVADSHRTVRYAPYVTYYPDSPAKKIVRNMVKKYKKTVKKYGLKRLLGGVPIVSEQEYRNNYRNMIKACGNRLVILPESIPQQETFRNEGIKLYNRTLEELASSHERCSFVRLFDDFISHLSDFYLDKGHPNQSGYDHIAAKVIQTIYSGLDRTS